VLEEALELGILAGEPALGVVGGFAGISTNDDRGHGVSESSTTQATKNKATKFWHTYNKYIKPEINKTS
jgi:hypothetical protein